MPRKAKCIGYIIRYSKDIRFSDYLRKRPVDAIDDEHVTINGNKHQCSGPLAHWYPTFEKAQQALIERHEEHVKATQKLANEALADLSYAKIITAEEVRASGEWKK